MNSVLQQLYMIPYFRKAILEIDTRQSYHEDDNKIMYELKVAFLNIHCFLLIYFKKFILLNLFF